MIATHPCLRSATFFEVQIAENSFERFATEIAPLLSPGVILPPQFAVETTALDTAAKFALAHILAHEGPWWAGPAREAKSRRVSFFLPAVCRTAIGSRLSVIYGEASQENLAGGLLTQALRDPSFLAASITTARRYVQSEGLDYWEFLEAGIRRRFSIRKS